jgi:hypothetical protein
MMFLKKYDYCWRLCVLESGSNFAVQTLIQILVCSELVIS